MSKREAEADMTYTAEPFKAVSHNALPSRIETYTGLTEIAHPIKSVSGYKIGRTPCPPGSRHTPALQRLPTPSSLSQVTRSEDRRVLQDRDIHRPYRDCPPHQVCLRLHWHAYQLPQHLPYCLQLPVHLQDPPHLHLHVSFQHPSFNLHSPKQLWTLPEQHGGPGALLKHWTLGQPTGPATDIFIQT